MQNADFIFFLNFAYEMDEMADERKGLFAERR